MTKPRVLSAETALAKLPDWSYDEDRKALSRALVFKDFDEAFGFMTQVALVAKIMDHHPDWSNVYNRVTVHLTTHDAAGVTVKDTELAAAIDAILAEPSGRDT